MTNTGKALIIALVLVDVGFIAYQMLPRPGHSEAVRDMVVTNPAVSAPSVSRADGTHVTAGNVVSTSPSANGAPEIAGTVANPTPTDARPQSSRHKQTGHAVASSQTRESVAAKDNSAQSLQRARGDLTRHGSNAVAAAMTAQLVRESSKPDPSLPMPPMPPTQTAPVSQDHHGANPVAAAMTQELVRESARISPASQGPAASGTQ